MYGLTRDLQNLQKVYGSKTGLTPLPVACQMVVELEVVPYGGSFVATLLLFLRLLLNHIYGVGQDTQNSVH